MRGLKNSAVKTKNLMRLIKKERRSVLSTSFTQKIKCYSKGFLSESYIIYNFKGNDPKNYLSDYIRFTKTPLININFGYLIDNKFLFDLYFTNTIKSLGLINLGLLYTKDEVMPLIPEIKKLLTSGNGLVIKPLGGGGGFGILFLANNNGIVEINGTPSTEAEILNKLSSPSGYILYKQFEQKGFSSLFYPNSLNTIRVVTMINPITRQPFIPSAVHRFGTKESKNVDNWSNGGLSASIDIKTGLMGKAVAYPRKGALQWHSIHPDSYLQIEGERVPTWEKVKEVVLSSANQISMIPYVGWDVVLSDNDILILEANTNSDVNLLQVHNPLLSVPGVKEFFKYHRVL